MFDQINFLFIMNSCLLGVGLAMDAFSVSVVNGMSEPKMKPARMGIIAGCYAFFQFAMPMIGWILVHTLLGLFGKLEFLIPWIALLLLLYIGGKMLIESIIEIRKAKKGEDEDDETDSSDAKKKLTMAVLLTQGVATSIDALSVGFTIAEYKTAAALIAAAIIAIVTFIICMIGLKIGKLAGKKLGRYAGIVGGCILIGIGIEIFVKGVFF